MIIKSNLRAGAGANSGGVNSGGASGAGKNSSSETVQPAPVPVVYYPVTRCAGF